MQRTIGARSPSIGSTRGPIRKGSLAIAALVGALLLGENAHATSVFRFENRRENPGGFRFLPEIGSLATSDNYDEKGAKAKVPFLTSYKKTYLDLTGVYGVNQNLSLFGRLSMASVSYDTTTITGSGSGLTEQAMGINYRLWESPAARGRAIDFQFQLDIPLYDNVSSRTSSPRQPLRGDGTLDITLAAFGTSPIYQGSGTRLFLIGGFGLSIRNNSYSKAIPYQLQIAGIPDRTGILYRLGFHGYKSMTSPTGAATDFSPQAQSTVGIVDPQDAGSSLIVDALNSSYMQLRASLGYQWNPIGDQLSLTYLMPMSGTSTAAITGILIGAQFRFGAAHKAAAPGTNPTSSGAKPKLAYDLAGRVKQANDRLNLIKIDKGEVDGVEKGNIFDVYRTNPDGTQGDLIARGVVTGVTENESVVNLRQYKKEVWVQAGFIARRIAPQKKP